ncbi:MAG: nitroreductase family protein [Succinivibrionaceae bacterium]|nr:nitroreductase family protein [Succinivibrionaceae bacterium]
MDASACLAGRRSVRTFNGRQVDRKVLEEIVALAAYAPSWKNSQTVSYIALTGEKKAKIAESGIMDHAGNRRNITSAPLLVAAITRKGVAGYNADGGFTTSKGDRWESFDAGIAVQTLCLAAHIHNVGSVIMGIFDEDKVAEILGLDTGVFKVAALVAMGYYDGTPQAPKRKPVSELLTIGD